MNEKFIHIESGKEYELMYFGKMKINQNWIECAIYNNDQEVFVREMTDFRNKFKKKKP